ncbi:hypothetical protein VTL71DRAFT_14544 [Oculimacula yallundae]|uniref:Uncharacterized protein n=1 Tax=Oculimacula yallundae TaxID=86028 RepID=A0ABR4CJD5_9HELO
MFAHRVKRPRPRHTRISPLIRREGNWGTAQPSGPRGSGVIDAPHTELTNTLSTLSTLSTHPANQPGTPIALSHRRRALPHEYRGTAIGECWEDGKNGRRLRTWEQAEKGTAWNFLDALPIQVSGVCQEAQQLRKIRLVAYSSQEEPLFPLALSFFFSPFLVFA